MKESIKDQRYIKDLPLNTVLKVRNTQQERCTLAGDAEVLIGGKQLPFLARRKYGKGYVYCINSNSNDMPMVVMRNLIKFKLFLFLFFILFLFLLYYFLFYFCFQNQPKSSTLAGWKKEEHVYWPDQFKNQIFSMLLVFKYLKKTKSLNIPKVLQMLIFEKISLHFI